MLGILSAALIPVLGRLNENKFSRLLIIKFENFFSKIKDDSESFQNIVNENNIIDIAILSRDDSIYLNEENRTEDNIIKKNELTGLEYFKHSLMHVNTEDLILCNTNGFNLAVSNDLNKVCIAVTETLPLWLIIIDLIEFNTLTVGINPTEETSKLDKENNEENIK